MSTSRYLSQWLLKLRVKKINSANSLCLQVYHQRSQALAHRGMDPDDLLNHTVNKEETQPIMKSRVLLQQGLRPHFKQLTQ